ncbi:MAG: hypothetical protein GY797_20950 [Deltaproteobacteria bacterium]|nr:hypothetical protein [Deltaproteobacteria bacterium]
MEDIECEYKDYSEMVVIEANRYRDKSIAEKSKEAKAYRKIFSEKAKENQKKSQGKGVKGCKNSDNLKPVDTKQEVAKAVGVSHDTLKKIDVIIEEKPEAVKDIDEGKKTVHAVYGGLRNKCHIRQKQSCIPEHLFSMNSMV